MLFMGELLMELCLEPCMRFSSLDTECRPTELAVGLADCAIGTLDVRCAGRGPACEDLWPLLLLPKTFAAVESPNFGN